MATQVSTASGLSPEIAQYYERVFLARAMKRLIHEQGAQKKTIPAGEGKQINFTRYTPLAIVTALSAEASLLTEVDLTASTVSATLVEYGNWAKIGKFLSAVSIDRNNKEKIEVFGQNMGESLDTAVRTELLNGTTQLAAGRANITAITTADVLNTSEIKKAVRTLEGNSAQRYDDGFYLGKIQPYTWYDLVGDSTWVNAKTYSDVRDLYMGEVGELFGVRFMLTNNGHSVSSTVNVYSNFIHGKDSFGCMDLATDSPKLYIKTPGAQSTDNPADRYSTIAWAGSYVCKVLNSNWIINIKTGATG
jgi:N4-gp56 family major capsid protein